MRGRGTILIRILCTLVVIVGASFEIGVINGDGLRKTTAMPATERELVNARLKIIEKVRDTLFALDDERTISASGYQINKGYLRLVYDKPRGEAIIFWEEGWTSLQFNVSPKAAMRIMTRREGKDGRIFIGETRQALEKELSECLSLLNGKLSKNPKPVIAPSLSGNWILQGGFTAGGGISHRNNYTLIGSIGTPGAIPYLAADNNGKKKENKEDKKNEQGK